MTDVDNKPKNDRRHFLAPLRRHPWLTGIGLAVVVSLLFIFLALPPIIRWGMEAWLESHGKLEAEVQEVDFNLFSGYLTVHSLVAERKDEGGMQWGRASLEIKWRPVFSKRIRLDDLSLTDARIDIEQEPDGALYIGGLRVREGEDGQPPAAEETQQNGWEVGFGAIDLQNVVLRYTGPAEITRVMVIASLHMDPLQSWDPSRTSRFKASIRIGDGQMAVDGSAQPFAAEAGIDMNLQIEGIPLAWAAPVLYALPVENLDGILVADAALGFASRNEGASTFEVKLDGTIRLQQMSGEFAGVPVDPTDLVWDGSLEVATTAGEGVGPQIAAEGALTADDADFRMPEANLTVAANHLRIDGRFSQNSRQPKKASDVGLTFEGAVTATGIKLDRPAEAEGEALQLQIGKLAYQPLQVQGNRGGETDLAVDGQLRLEQARGELAGARIEPTALSWDGSLQVAAIGAEAGPPRFVAEGGLSAEDPDLRLPETNLAVAANHLRLDGRFAQNLGPPEGSGAAGLTFEGAVTAADLQLDRPAEAEGGPLHLQIAQLAYQPLDLRGRLEGNTRFQLDGQLDLDQVRGELNEVHVGPTGLNWDGSLEVAATEAQDEGLRFVADGALAANGAYLRLPAGELAFAADALRVEGRLSQNDGGQPEGDGMTLDGQGALERLVIEGTGNGVTLARSRQIDFQGLGLREGDQISAGGVQLTEVAFLERPGRDSEALDHVLSMPSASLKDFQLDLGGRRIVLDTLAMPSVNAAVLRTKDGLTVAGLLPEAWKEDEPPEETPSAPWTYRIGTIVIEDQGRLAYRDTSVSPTVDLTVSQLQVTLQDLDSAAPGQRASITIRGEMGGYSSIQASGKIRPFGEAVSMDIEGEVKQFSLPEVRAYAERYWGYSIRSGQLYADFHLQAEQARLDSEVKLFITSLNLVRQGSEELDEFTEQLGMPLNTALNLIRNSDGNIALTLPVTGSFANPDIGIDDVIGTALRKATLQGIKTAALSYFAPLGAAYAATKVLGKITALRLKPVYFAPGESELDDENRDYLREVAGKLEDRPEVGLVLCGTAVPEDAAALGGSVEGSASPPSVVPENSRTAVPDARLLDLAENRAETVRTYLVEGGIDSRRLAICAPAIAEEGSRPQVELAL